MKTRCHPFQFPCDFTLAKWIGGFAITAAAAAVVVAQAAARDASAGTHILNFGSSTVAMN